MLLSFPMLIQVSPAFQTFAASHFYERPVLVPFLANKKKKKSEEDFLFYKKRHSLTNIGLS